MTTQSTRAAADGRKSEADLDFAFTSFTANRCRASLSLIANKNSYSTSINSYYTSNNAPRVVCRASVVH